MAGSAVNINVVGTYDGRDIARAQRELDGLASQVRTVGDRFQGAADQFQNVGRSMSRVGGNLTRSVTMPLIGVAGAGAKMATDFESSFAKIEGLVGVSGQDLEQLRSAALELGPAYGASANEAADALFFITSAGLRGAEATEVLEASLMASAAGLGEAATIADLATSAMNAYGSDVLSAAGATDILTAAVREGKLEPDELAGAMGATLPVASAMGIGFDEVGAAFAAMSRTGTGASEAATQLRGIMTSLLSPSVQAEEALNEMGLSSEGLKEQIREQGLLSTLETLASTFEDNEVGAEAVFGNVRALSGVLDLMGSNVEGTRAIFGAMADTTGTLDNAFAVTSETAGFQFAQAMAEMKSALLEVGEIILPTVRDIATRIQELVQRFRDLSPEQQEQIVRFAAIAAAVGPVILILGKLFTSIGSIIKGVMALGKAFMFLAANPIGVILLAIAAVIAIGVLLYRNWDTIKAAAAELWTSIKDFFGRIGDWISEKISVAKDAFSTAVDGMKEALKTAANFIISYWNAILAGVERVVNGIVRAVNRIPSFTVPDWVPEIGGSTFGLPKLREISLPRIPALAEGGIVDQATLALIGEAGPEAVVPLDRLGSVGGATINITVTSADPQAVVEALRRYTRANGPLGAVVSV
jgi:TP901 family phage tail tape measure protein